ncbi:MAG: DUF5615 family PIN-like protein [Bacteroidota bacterium]
MRILCDVHIAIKVAKYFTSKGIETKHVNQILDKWYSQDKDICEYADKNGFTVVTKDTDFKNSHFLNQTPKKLIKVNLGNISTNKLIAILDHILDKLEKLFEENNKCYVEINTDDITIIPDKNTTN